MNFDLHLYGETPEELLNVLAHLGHMDSNYHTPIPDERHPAQLPPRSPRAIRCRRRANPRRRHPPSRKRPHRSPQPSLRRSLQTLPRQKLGFSLAGGCRTGDLNLRARIRTRC